MKKKLPVSISKEAREMLENAAEAHGVSVSEEMEQSVHYALQRNPLATPSISKSEWDKSFEELEPHICEDGTVLKRYRLVNIGGVPIENGPICTQVRDWLIKCELIERKPMELPKGSIFFMDFIYGKHGGLDDGAD